MTATPVPSPVSRLPWWWLVAPRFEEPPSVETCRLASGIRLLAVLVCLGLNASALFAAESIGLDGAFVRRYAPLNLGLLLVDGLLAAVGLRIRLGLRPLRVLLYACTALDVASVLLNLWGLGSVDSFMVAYAIALVTVYRLFFDFRLAAFGLLLVGGGLIALAAAQARGWLPPQPGWTTPPAAAYLVPARLLQATAAQVFLLVLAFFAANATVLRLRHKDVVIRFLRQTMAARGAAELGHRSGTTLRDTYEVGPLLAQGGMGEVYRGRHLRTQRPVAIKTLHPHLVDDVELLSRFRREAEIAGRLGSKHIVEVLDVDQADGVPFLVMELLEGESLRALVERQGPLPVPMVVGLVEQIAEGLTVAHGAGVVHRDLKPENVLLCRDGDQTIAKIVDFGLSKIRGAATALTQDVALFGTPDFMSPEQAEGITARVDERTDVFALGAIAYYGLTGWPPFAADSVLVVLARVCGEEPLPLVGRRPEVTPALAEVIGRAMAKRHDQRYPSAAAFAAELRAALEDRLDDAALATAQGRTRGRAASAPVRRPPPRLSPSDPPAS